MGQRDPRVDEYIARSAEFAKPILRRVRQMVHSQCPDASETIKWGFPHFDYQDKIFCSMAAFKAHCAFGFWLGPLLQIDAKTEKAMGQFGRIASLEDLPDDKTFAKLIQAAMKLQESGAKVPARAKPKGERAPLEVPAVLAAALKKNKAARIVFDGFSYTNRKDYIDWINEAKTEPTREKRLAQTIEWLAGGKVRNWKYLKC